MITSQVQFKYLTSTIGIKFSNNYLPFVLENDLESFLKLVIAASGHGISPLLNSTNDLNWSFGQAFFFSGTVITTIGKQNNNY